jgi:hypothetical protein
MISLLNRYVSVPIKSLSIKRFNSFSAKYNFEDYYLSFFNACRLPIIRSKELEFNNISQNHPKNIIEVSSEDKLVKMYVLPKSIDKWPSFYCGKQYNAANKHLFFHRVSDTHRLRFEAIVNLLRNGEQMVSTGVSGIGKSAELNAYLMVLLKHMGEEGWPKEVWYRFNVGLLQYKLSDGVPTVTVLEDIGLKDLRILASDYSLTPIKDRPVAIVELSEDETNPCPEIPILLQPSNRDIFELTKELCKANATYFLVNPPSTTDLVNMAWFQANFGAESSFRGKTKVEISRLIKERVNLVGPIPRAVLGSEVVFKSYINHIEENVDEFFNISRKIKISNIPKYAKYFIAPFVDDESVIPYLSQGDPLVPCSLRILSDHIGVLLSRACDTDSKRQLLNATFTHLIKEAVIRYGLTKQSIQPVQSDNAYWNVDNWSFYKNPLRKDKTLESEDKIAYEDTGITRCTKLKIFDSQYINRSVDMLDEDTLYFSTKHNCALYDCMYVDKAHKIVFMFNPTRKMPHVHPLNPSTVQEVMQNMKITENGYKIRFFFCYDSTLHVKEGCENVKGLEIYIAKVKILQCDIPVE